MKRYLILLTGCLAFFGSTAQEKPLNDLEKLGLKGPVRSVRETRISHAVKRDSSTSTFITFDEMTRFNQDGYENHITIYRDSKIFSLLRFSFDTSGYPSGLKEYTEAGTLWLSVTYKLDEKGNRIAATYDWPEKRGYDEIREKSDQLYEVLDRHPWDLVMFENDYRGFPLEEKYLTANGDMLFRFNYRYDIKGLKMEMTYYNFKGRTSWETKYKYDRYGNLVASTVYKSNRVAARSSYAYSFDAYGNWTTRTEKREVEDNIFTLSLEAGTFMIQREIEYY